MIRLATSTPARRMAVAPRAPGGQWPELHQALFEMADKPNPNNAADTVRRGFVASGDPRRPANVAQLRADAERADQVEAANDAAYAQQQRAAGQIDTVGMQNMQSMNRTANAQSPWALFLQALKNAGVDKIQTGARAGMGPRGFFDTQATMSTPERQRLELLKAMNINDGRDDQAAIVEHMIRRGSGG